MNVFELTRTLVDIESITGNEEHVGEFLHQYLAPLAERYGGRVERMERDWNRENETWNKFGRLGFAEAIGDVAGVAQRAGEVAFQDVGVQVAGLADHFCVET